MQRYRYAVTLVVCGLLAASTDASAQMREWTDRGYANINVGFEGGADTLSAVRDFVVYQEPGRVTVNQDVDSGPFFDFAVGARVWRNISVGIGFHRGSTDGNAVVQGSVPHPVFFGRPRDFTTEVGGLDRTAQAVHLSFGYMFVIDDKLDVLIYGGPSFFRLSQDVVSDIRITEAGAPFTTVVVEPQVVERKDSADGAHIGADVTYKFYERGRLKIGGGAFMRYAGAQAAVRVLDTDQSSDVGGFQFGFGLRTRF